MYCTSISLKNQLALALRLGGEWCDIFTGKFIQDYVLDTFYTRYNYILTKLS